MFLCILNIFLHVYFNYMFVCLIDYRIIHLISHYRLNSIYKLIRLDTKKATNLWWLVALDHYFFLLESYPKS